MTYLHIAGAACAGKGAFDRAAILRSAHALARQRLANNRAWRSYRQAFADALRREWRLAKDARESAEFEAREKTELPADVEARCYALRQEADYQPHTGAGQDRFRALYREAERMANSARAAALRFPTLVVEMNGGVDVFDLHQQGVPLAIFEEGELRHTLEPLIPGAGLRGFAICYPPAEP